MCADLGDRQLSSQQLWTTIQISHRRLNDSASISLYLERSGSLPLDITIWWYPATEELKFTHSDGRTALWEKIVCEYRPTLHTRLEIVLGQVARWRAFQLVLEDWNLLQSNVAWFSGFTAPQRTALWLSYCRVLHSGEPRGRTPVPEPLGPVFAHDGVPSISYCVIDGVHLGLAPLSGHILTHLFIREQKDSLNTPFQDIISILEHSPNIRTLHILVCEGFHDPLLDSTKRIYPPSLEQLFLEDVRPVFAHSLLKQIVAPSMRIVRLGFTNGFFDALIETLSVPYIHSGRSVLRSVEALRVDAIILLRTDPDPAEEMYHDFDSLRVLVIERALSRSYYRFLPSIVRLTRSSLSLASQSDHTPAICIPRLSTLVLSDPFNPDIDELKELITIRRAVGAPIKRLLIQIDWIIIPYPSWTLTGLLTTSKPSPRFVRPDPLMPRTQLILYSKRCWKLIWLQKRRFIASSEVFRSRVSA
ncbi:uncharacterized protein STEHIDRAFT_141005 [Stereum hirsutum FP-91666 SS1]|uniref:uncharacterized protein n=1 Tax=Stereum hirsutum (strain FP-91666) TaxID=721885 RepID=UPI0004449BE3|nr:uncharacterized protein STEHIDRAFT_141005 [Stereum hirsutum FP-91666 SS1]EIM84107.1 hypothetical protein STEHIDRAFT_141005 [Stereum hirsutum FP-91666 SS1]